MSRSLLMVLALWASWSPPALAWLAVVAAAPWCAARLPARWPVALGLAAIAASGWAPLERPSPPCREGAVRLEGVLRRESGARSPTLDVGGERVVLVASGVGLPVPGTRVEITGRISARGRVTPVACHERGRVALLHPASLDRLSLAASARLRTVVPRAQRGIVAALVLGDRRDLPDPLRRAAIDSGTSHLLALSGLHVSIIAAWLTRLLPALALPARAGTGGGLLLFVALAGARPPLLRAASTWVLGAGAMMLGRRSDALDRLAVAAVLLAVWSPEVTQQLGTRLSFCAVAGLVAVGRALPGRWAAAAPLGAFAATAPLCVETFGVAQPLGVAWSWALGPLVALVMALGLLTLCTRSPWLDAALTPAITAAASSLEAAFDLAARWSPPLCRPAPLPCSGWVASLLVVAALVACTPKRGAAWESLS